MHRLFISGCGRAERFRQEDEAADLRRAREAAVARAGRRRRGDGGGDDDDGDGDGDGDGQDGGDAAFQQLSQAEIVDNRDNVTVYEFPFRGPSVARVGAIAQLNSGPVQRRVLADGLITMLVDSRVLSLVRLRQLGAQVQVRIRLGLPALLVEWNVTTPLVNVDEFDDLADFIMESIRQYEGSENQVVVMSFHMTIIVAHGFGLASGVGSGIRGRGRKRSIESEFTSGEIKAFKHKCISQNVVGGAFLHLVILRELSVSTKTWKRYMDIRRETFDSYVEDHEKLGVYLQSRNSGWVGHNTLEDIKIVSREWEIPMCIIVWQPDNKLYEPTWFSTKTNPRGYDANTDVMYILKRQDEWYWVTKINTLCNKAGYCIACVQQSLKHVDNCLHYTRALSDFQQRMKDDVHFPMVFRGKKRDTFIRLNRKDDLCGACAVLIAVEYWKFVQKRPDEKFDDYRNDSGKVLTQAAIKLHRDCKIPLEGGVTTCDIQKMCDRLKCDVRIVSNSMYIKITDKLLCHQNVDRKVRQTYIIPQCYIYYENNHFDVILKANRILGRKFQCDHCFKVVSNSNHTCSSLCRYCKAFGGQHPNTPGFHRQCDTCYNTFYNPVCFKLHVTNLVCKRTIYCLDCKKRVIQKLGAEPHQLRSLDDHICHEFYCSMCKDICPPPKHDHACIMNALPEPKKASNWEYAFYDVETYRTTPTTELKLDTRYVHKICHWEFQHDDQGRDDARVVGSTSEELVNYMLGLEGKYIIFAHNGQAFDHIFILKEIVKRRSITKPPRIIANGSKVMQMDIVLSKTTTLRFVDSLNFMRGRLASFPKTYGISTSDVWNGLDQKVISQTTILDQFSQDDDGKFVDKGFYPYTFDKKANWGYSGDIPPLSYFEPGKKTPDDRKRLVKWWVGYNDSKFVYNLKRERAAYCHVDVLILRFSVMKFRALMMDTAELDPLLCTTIAQYSMKVYRTKFLLPDAIVRYSMNDNKNFRESLHGGRVNCLKTYWKSDGKQKAYYYDVNSLYPSRQMFCRLPFGQAEYTKNPNVQDITSFGNPEWLYIVKVDVVCPKDLLIPVLPARVVIDGTTKLRFDLVDKKDYWTNSVELRMALSKGYSVTKIHEMYLWKNTTTDMFKGYMQTFVGKKTEAAGWPDGVRSEEEKKVYLDRIEDKVGIRLEAKNIVSNKGKKSVSKLLCNSLWGKTVQRENTVKSRLTNSPQSEMAMFRMLQRRDSKNRRVFRHTTFLSLSEHVCYFRFKHVVSENSDPLEHVSVPIGVFVTAHARVCLYKALFELGYRVLYFDTDSVIFYCEEGETPYMVLSGIGNVLGDWESELGPGEYIDEFVSLGPKNYGYRYTQDGKTHKYVSKTKGLYVSKVDQRKNYDCQRFLAKAHANLLVRHTHKLYDFDMYRFGVSMDEKKNQLVYRLGARKNFLRDKYNVVYEYETVKATRMVSDKRIWEAKRVTPFITDSIPFGYSK